MIKVFFKRAAALLLVLLCIPGITALAEGVSPRTAERRADYIPKDEITSLEQVKSPSPSQDFTFMRVLITTGTTSYIDLDLYGKYYFGGSGIIYGAEDGTVFPIRVRASSGNVTVTERSSDAELASGASVQLHRAEAYYEAGYAKLTYCASSKTKDRMYLGDFTFSADGSSVRMINTVPMAYYLYGIVGYELNAYCQPEALKAQAIASKVFGMYFMDPSEPYDVQDGYTRTVYQAYRGFRENRLATMPYCIAVTGEAMSYNGTILYASYGHSNGGETSLPSHHSSSGNTQYDGAYEVVLDDIEFDNYTECTETVNVRFGGVGDDSRFVDFVLCKAEESMGAAPTRLVSISEFYAYDPLPGTQRNMRKLHVKARLEFEQTDGGEGEVSHSEFTLDCPTSDLREYAIYDIDGSGDSYSSCRYAFEENYRLYWGVETEDGYTLYFTRYGYGTGLSQMGAEIRANPDTYAQDYRQILSFYYPHFDMISIQETPIPEATGYPGTTEPEVVAYGVCTGTSVNFRVGPSTSFGTIGKVGHNEHIDIIGLANSEWYHAVWNGHEGYISIGYVSIVLFPSPAGGVFTLMDGRTTTSANLRSEPRTNSANLITTLPKNTTMTAWMHMGKWYFVTTDNGYSGFISNVVAEFSEPYEYAGVTSILGPTRRIPVSAKPIGDAPQPPQWGRIGAE